MTFKKLADSSRKSSDEKKTFGEVDGPEEFNDVQYDLINASSYASSRTSNSVILSNFTGTLTS